MVQFSNDLPYFTPLALTAEGVLVMDQRLLPSTEDWLTLTTVPQMVTAIADMIVRGAPTIGVAAAYGMVLSARNYSQHDTTVPPTSDFWQQWAQDKADLDASRPTAVNLAWALTQIDTKAQQCAHLPWAEFSAAIEAYAVALHQQELQACLAIGKHGAAELAPLIPTGATILTHCNAGALATAGYGTALGVIQAAYDADPTITVFASETRPRLQGAKLTAWELAKAGIPVTVVSDNMVAHLMQHGRINAVVTGADRIAANGDSANKIGTYSHALAARAHNIPFYIAAPMSTVDMALATGAEIPIEERSHDELWHAYGGKLPDAVTYLNPAFDVTPANLIAGIITQHGVARPQHTEQPFASFNQQPASYLDETATVLV